jgi:hypothetical protein
MIRSSSGPGWKIPLATPWAFLIILTPRVGSLMAGRVLRKRGSGWSTLASSLRWISYNKTHAPWIHPGTLVEQNSSLLDLYEGGEKREECVFSRTGQGQKSWRDPQNLLKNTSLNLTDAQGQRVGPEISDPFDLHKVMLDQLQWLKGSPTR